MVLVNSVVIIIPRKPAELPEVLSVLILHSNQPGLLFHDVASLAWTIAADTTWPIGEQRGKTESYNPDVLTLRPRYDTRPFMSLAHHDCPLPRPGHHAAPLPFLLLIVDRHWPLSSSSGPPPTAVFPHVRTPATATRVPARAQALSEKSRIWGMCCDCAGLKTHMIPLWFLHWDRDMINCIVFHM